MTEVVVAGYPYPVDALCAYEMFPADRNLPAEYCGNETEPGSDYCTDHDPLLGEPDWDDRRKELLYECYD